MSDDLREREDDIIWRLKWRGADEWMYIYLLIEFQSEHDRYMSVRVMSYLGLLYQDLINTGEVAGQSLPPVLPMVVYRGEQRWTSPLNIKGIIRKPPPGLERYLPSLRFLLLEEVQMNEAELGRMCNLAAEIFRIEKSPTLKASIPPFVSFLKWTTKAGAQQDSLKRAMKVWFSRAQKPAKILNEEDAVDEMAFEEIEPMLSERIEKWSKELVEQGHAQGLLEGRSKGKAEGLLEGESKGKAEGKIEMFLSLYEMKFGPVPRNLRSSIETATAEEILLMSERLLTAESSEALFPSKG